MPYKCSKCNSDITEEQTAKTVEKFGKALCNKCILASVEEGVEGAPSAPPPKQNGLPGSPDSSSLGEIKKPAQQTYNVGDGSGDDVPELKHDETYPTNTPTTKKGSVINMIRSYVGDDVLQVFGPTGSGKSKFALECARQALADGLKVFYLDTERNLTDDDIKSLKGCDYRYTPVLEEIDKMCQTLPKCDVVIIDSIGFPILTAYARYSMKQKGDALLKLIAIFGDLKQWAYKNNGLAIVTNQPESDFNKAPGHLIRPFGDKSQFACKEIWRTDVKTLGKTTKSEIRAFRSRSMGHKTLIANMEISDIGVSIVEASK